MIEPPQNYRVVPLIYLLHVSDWPPYHQRLLRGRANFGARPCRGRGADTAGVAGTPILMEPLYDENLLVAFLVFGRSFVWSLSAELGNCIPLLLSYRGVLVSSLQLLSWALYK